jgi:hypothetical protein
MSALSLTGVVVQAIPTKGGGWVRVILGGNGRVNDLVMVPADSEYGKGIKVGAEVTLPVRASVETTAEGRPTRSITYFLADRAA